MSKHTSITSQVALWKWILLRTDTTDTSIPFRIGIHTCSYCNIYLSGCDCFGCPIGNNCTDTAFNDFYYSIFGSDYTIGTDIDLLSAQDSAEEMIDYLETLIEYGNDYNDN